MECVFISLNNLFDKITPPFHILFTEIENSDLSSGFKFVPFCAYKIYRSLSTTGEGGDIGLLITVVPKVL